MIQDISNATIAYFSMEICLEQAIPTYSGGLGVLAGDTLRSAADLQLPMVAVTLVHRNGYFRQQLDAAGQQIEAPATWNPAETLVQLAPVVRVRIDGREVAVRAWRYDVRGVTGHVVPVFLLDTALPENSEWDRTITDSLYGGDSHYRLCQEIVLGMGGAAMLEALGIGGDMRYHINEGHAALLTLWRLERQLADRSHWDVTDADIEAVRRQCIFTTHTPVPAGHDKFPEVQTRALLGEARADLLKAIGCLDDGVLNMTHLALRLSRYVNGVALRHREVSQGMFPTYPINSITNGVHAATWTSAPVRELFDRHIPEWRRDNLYLRYAVNIPLDEIRETHARSKRELLGEVERRTGVVLDPAAMTVGFARRATPYKRADLIFTDLERLKSIAQHSGPLQIIFGGKAHPRDEGGKQLIRHIFEARDALGDAVKVVYLENYEMGIAQYLVSGVDLWLNNPMKPLEASGTSGMKAALNGIPSLSVLDGWWVEGHVEGVTGWSIGSSDANDTDQSGDVNDLYLKLERVILPLFYGLPYSYAQVMRSAMALNGSFFNTQRMVMQYIRNAYFPPAIAQTGDAPALEHATETVQQAWEAVG
ncbi:MAG TPA: alpha-glucan family phosphorylase [Gemmatimonadaceae bacterium]|nr:alpha-glucan family phosphorylase [Gemmatimonadaceae bacterium]